MPIRVNNSDSFPGAESLFVPPVVKADCCLFQTRQAMAEHAAAEGWPYTIKGGVVHVDASLAEIQTVCLIGEPTITGLDPDPIVAAAGLGVTGTNFGTVEGELWLGNASTWAGSSTRIQQPIQSWGAENVICPAVAQDGLPGPPDHVYVYVINDCGERNAVGYETEFSV